MNDIDINLLLGTIPDPRLARLSGLSLQAIHRRRKHRGVPSYTSQYSRLPRRKYNFNAFDDLDETSAYWLGLYFADGNLSRISNQITLCTCDFELVEKLILFYGDDKDAYCVSKPKVRTWKVRYDFSVYNEHLYTSTSKKWKYITLS